MAETHEWSGEVPYLGGRFPLEAKADRFGYATQPTPQPESLVVKQLVDLQYKTDEERRQLHQETIALRKERHHLREMVRKLELDNAEMRDKLAELRD